MYNQQIRNWKYEKEGLLMSHWNSENKNVVIENLYGAEVLFIDINKKNRSPNSLSNLIPDYDIILGYSNKYNVYVAWNAYLHKGRNSVSAQLKPRDDYHGISHARGELKDNKSGMEKQVIIEPDFLIRFCKDWLFYMMPTEDDKNGFDIKFMWADREHPIATEIGEFEDTIFHSKKRTTYIHQTYERDSSFRKKVLENYDYRCAICHCTVEPILEAHHITYVSDNGSDNLENGICLCRNHHKMIHSKLITLNMQNNTYDIESTIREDLLTSWAIENFEKNLLIPKSRR